MSLYYEIKSHHNVIINAIGSTIGAIVVNLTFGGFSYLLESDRHDQNYNKHLEDTYYSITSSLTKILAMAAMDIVHPSNFNKAVVVIGSALYNVFSSSDKDDLGDSSLGNKPMLVTKIEAIKKEIYDDSLTRSMVGEVIIESLKLYSYKELGSFLTPSLNFLFLSKVHDDNYLTPLSYPDLGGGKPSIGVIQSFYYPYFDEKTKQEFGAFAPIYESIYNIPKHLNNLDLTAIDYTKGPLQQEDQKFSEGFLGE